MDPLEIRRTRPARSNIEEPVRASASQTAGPYVHIGCLPNMAGIEGVYPDLTSNGPGGQNGVITISGHIFDGDGEVCKDVMLEFWQADETGDFSNGLWHRTGTDLKTGAFSIRTALPGAFNNESGEVLAPFISVWVTARGINLGLLTRIYFPEHEEENAQDPHLSLVPEDRRSTLLARAGEGSGSYEFNICLQGERETVFFET